MCVRNLLKWIGPIGVDSEEGEEQVISKRLWGYPDLVKEFHDRVRPALVEARDERRERERREDMTSEYSSDKAPAAASHEEGGTVSTPTQSSHTAHPDDGPGPSDAREIGVQQDSPAQQYNRPPPPNEHQFTASSGTEAQDPTSGDPDIPLDVSGIRGESILSNDIVEVASISEYEDERSRVAQRKGKGRE